MSRNAAKFALRTALVVQMLGLCVLIASGPAVPAAFCVVIGAGIAEVILALLARRRNDAIEG